jgi:hypothetical protein
VLAVIRPLIQRADSLLISAPERALGIFAERAIVDYGFDQPFKDLDEALSFWKHHMRLKGGRWDMKLKEFLSERLQWWGGRLWAIVQKQSVIIWWRCGD